MKTKLHSHAHGFTLMEMMLVIGIITLLVGAGIVAIVGMMDVGKTSRVKADLNTLTSALRAYETENMVLPTTEQGLMSLVERPASRPQPPNWRMLLKKVLLDPWGNPYQYRRPAQKDKGPFDLWSNGPDGTPNTGDDIGNWQL